MKARSQEEHRKLLAMQEAKRAEAERVQQQLIEKQEEMRRKDYARMQMMEMQRKERALHAEAREKKKQAKAAAAAAAQERILAEKLEAQRKKDEDAERLRRLQEQRREEAIEQQRAEALRKQEKLRLSMEAAARVQAERIERIREQERKQNELLYQQQLEKEAEEERRKMELEARRQELERKLQSARAAEKARKNEIQEKMKEKEEAMKVANEKRRLELEEMAERRRLLLADRQEMIERSARADEYKKMLKEKEFEEERQLNLEMTRVRDAIVKKKQLLDAQLEKERQHLKAHLEQLATKGASLPSVPGASDDSHILEHAEPTYPTPAESLAKGPKVPRPPQGDKSKSDMKSPKAAKISGGSGGGVKEQSLGASGGRPVGDYADMRGGSFSGPDQMLAPEREMHTSEGEKSQVAQANARAERGDGQKAEVEGGNAAQECDGRQRGAPLERKRNDEDLVNGEMDTQDVMAVMALLTSGKPRRVCSTVYPGRPVCVCVWISCVPSREARVIVMLILCLCRHSRAGCVPTATPRGQGCVRRRPSS